MSTPIDIPLTSPPERPDRQSTVANALAISRKSTPILAEPAIPAVQPTTGSSRYLTRALLLAGDVVSLAVSFALVFIVHLVLMGHGRLGGGIVGAGIAWLILRWYLRLYSPEGMAAPEEFRRSVIATFVAGVAHVSILFALQQVNPSRFIAFGTWLFVLPVSSIVRHLLKRGLIAAGRYGVPVVLFGAGPTGALIVRELLSNPDIGLTPVAAFDDDPQKAGTTVHGVPVIGPIALAETAAAAKGARNAIVALPAVGSDGLVQFMRRYARRFPTIRVVPNLFGVGHLWVQPGSLGTCLTLELRQDRFDVRVQRIKRAFDLVLGVPLLLLALPIIGLVALTVVILSPGMPLFPQEREGLEGRRIRVWKIRTMVRDAEEQLEDYLSANPTARNEWERRMKLRADPRVIPFVGSLFRRFSLDELPQLWNVVRGDLSLVGPRPFPDYHLCRFSDAFRELRRQVPPGITGYWQIMSRSDGDLEVQEAADSYYVHNWSLWLDFWILFRTAGVVVSGRGAY